MYFLNSFIILSVLAVFSHAKVVNVKNSRSTAIVVSAGDAQYTVLSNEVVVLPTTDEWSVKISAIPVDAEVTNGPKTNVELTLGATVDSYSVSLVDGYNLGVIVVPNSSTGCSAAICTTNLLRTCPLENQVTNSLGAVVACQNSPLIMSKLCPLAVVDEASSLNVQNCVGATSYLVIFT